MRYSNRSLEKYAKTLFGITNVKFKIVKNLRKWGRTFGGFCQAYTDGTYIITLHQAEVKNTTTLWHELGHVVTRGKNKTNREYNAHMWALTQAQNRGYYRLLQSLIEDIDSWKNERYFRYRKARKKILCG